MNARSDNQNSRFPLARIAAPGTLALFRRMTRLLMFGALSALALSLAGCAHASRNADDQSSESALLATLPTPELETRRAALVREIASIEREVEMKAGLHMGVGISDERGRLSELYRQEKSIERELLRRSAYTKL